MLMTDNTLLAKYLNADPAADALKAYQKDDLRFLAVRGYTVIVPGIPDFQEKFASKYTYRVIEGTSDALSGPADRKLQLGVRDYAKKYNQALLSHVGK